MEALQQLKYSTLDLALDMLTPQNNYPHFAVPLLLWYVEKQT